MILMLPLVAIRMLMYAILMRARRTILVTYGTVVRVLSPFSRAVHLRRADGRCGGGSGGNHRLHCAGDVVRVGRGLALLPPVARDLGCARGVQGRLDICLAGDDHAHG